MLPSSRTLESSIAPPCDVLMTELLCRVPSLKHPFHQDASDSEIPERCFVPNEGHADGRP